jgi:tetratricopeptide (TPR) repeat protein
MLETIREFAREWLEDSGEGDDLRRRHAEFYVDVAESANLNPNTYDATRPIRHDIAAREQNEIYQALGWALETGASLVGLRLATAAGGWLWSINSPSEGVRYFEQLFERTDVSAVPPVVLADGLREYAAQAFLAGDHEQAERLTRQSLALYEQIGDERGRAVMLHRLAVVMLWKGELDRARTLVDESHATHERNSDQWGMSQTLGTLGAIARDLGDEATAYDLFSKSAQIARGIGGGYADWWASGMIAELACISLDTDRPEEAERHARAALEMADALRDRAGRVFGVGVLAAVAAARGQLERAECLWKAVEGETASAPLGGWRRHRASCERLVREARVGNPQFSQGGERLNLDDAVRLALEEGDGPRG